jgi:hypothetical protein
MLENSDHSTEVVSANINKHLTLEGNLSMKSDGSDEMVVATNPYKLVDDCVVSQACSPSCIPSREAPIGDADRRLSYCQIDQD